MVLGARVQCFSEGSPSSVAALLCQGAARGHLQHIDFCQQDLRALRSAAKPGLEQAAGGSPGLECFWVWGWRAEGRNGRGRRAALHKPAVRTSVLPEGHWPPLLETLTYGHRTTPGGSKELLCCLFPGRQVSSLSSPPAPPRSVRDGAVPYCTLSRLMSLAAGSISSLVTCWPSL